MPDSPASKAELRSRGSLRLWVLAVGLAALAAAVAGVVIFQVSESPLVDHTTAAPLAPLQRQGTVTGIGAGHVRWRVSTASAQAASLLVAGWSLVLMGHDGVTVLDGRTGRERWHYRRRGAVVEAAAVTADDRFLVVRMRWYSDFAQQRWLGLTLGFSLDTGQLRWQHAGSQTSQSLIPFGDDMLMTCTFGGFREFGGPVCGSSATVFNAASGAPVWQTQYCGPLGPAGGAAALAGAVSPGPGCPQNTIEILTANGARHLWRPPHGGRLSDFTLVPPPPIGPAPGGFLIPFQLSPGKRQSSSWAVELVAASGAQGMPVPLPCQDPAVVQQSAQVVACASAAAGSSGWTVTAGGIDLAGRVRWQRQLSFPSQPHQTASGGMLYLSTGQRPGQYQTLAIRIGDGTMAGRVPGFLIGAGTGLAVIAAPHGQVTTLTAFS